MNNHIYFRLKMFLLILSFNFFLIQAENNCSHPSLLIKTYRLIETTSDFSIKYFFNSSLSAKQSQLIIEGKNLYFYEFIIDLSNIGGSLNFIVNKITMHQKSFKKELFLGIEIYLHACLMFNSMDIRKKCNGGYKIVTQSFSHNFSSIELNVAYPMIGKWYLALWKECIDPKKYSNFF